VPVPFIESDSRRSHAADQAGHSVVFGDPLDERTFQQARTELVESVVGLTFNEHIARLFAREAKDTLSVSYYYVTLEAIADDSTCESCGGPG